MRPVCVAQSVLLKHDVNEISMSCLLLVGSGNGERPCGTIRDGNSLSIWRKVSTSVSRLSRPSYTSRTEPIFFSGSKACIGISANSRADKERKLMNWVRYGTKGLSLFSLNGK